MTDEEMEEVRSWFENAPKKERKRFVASLIKAWGREEFLIALATAHGKEVSEIEEMIANKPKIN
jgi:hypothetical protein